MPLCIPSTCTCGWRVLPDCFFFALSLSQRRPRSEGRLAFPSVAGPVTHGHGDQQCDAGVTGHRCTGRVQPKGAGVGAWAGQGRGTRAGRASKDLCARPPARAEAAGRGFWRVLDGSRAPAPAASLAALTNRHVDHRRSGSASAVLPLSCVIAARHALLARCSLRYIHVPLAE